MRKSILAAVCLVASLIGCSPTETTTVDASADAEEATAPAPAEVGACELSSFMGEASSPGASLIFLPLHREARWGASVADMQRLGRRIAPRVERDGQQVTAYVNGNHAWVSFQFAGDRLVEVRERHNNPRRSPPFAGAFLRSLTSELGEPATVREESNGACNAVWPIEGGTLTAVWRDSEWFLDVFYAPSAAAAETLSDSGGRLGQWCDAAWPATLSLHQGANGAFSLSLQFHPRGQATRNVVLRNGAYHDLESDFGERYHVGPGGELQIFDREGFVRSARPGPCPQ